LLWGTVFLITVGVLVYKTKPSGESCKICLAPMVTPTKSGMCRKCSSIRSRFLRFIKNSYTSPKSQLIIVLKPLGFIGYLFFVLIVGTDFFATIIFRYLLNYFTVDFLSWLADWSLFIIENVGSCSIIAFITWFFWPPK
jgi:hypothetical protein